MLNTKNKQEVLYGIHPVLEALNAGRRKIHELYITNNEITQRHRMILKLAERRDICVKKLPSQQLSSIADTTRHQGTCARVSNFPSSQFDDFINDKSQKDDLPFYMILDSIQDPNNFQLQSFQVLPPFLQNFVRGDEGLVN